MLGCTDPVHVIGAGTAWRRSSRILATPGMFWLLWLLIAARPIAPLLVVALGRPTTAGIAVGVVGRRIPKRRATVLTESAFGICKDGNSAEVEACSALIVLAAPGSSRFPVSDDNVRAFRNSSCACCSSCCCCRDIIQTSSIFTCSLRALFSFSRSSMRFCNPWHFAFRSWSCCLLRTRDFAARPRAAARFSSIDSILLFLDESLTVPYNDDGDDDSSVIIRSVPRDFWVRRFASPELSEEFRVRFRSFLAIEAHALLLVRTGSAVSS